VEEERPRLPYQIDGVVPRWTPFRSNVDGWTAKAPRWAIAFKFSAEQQETVVEDIASRWGGRER